MYINTSTENVAANAGIPICLFLFLSMRYINTAEKYIIKVFAIFKFIDTAIPRKIILKNIKISLVMF